MPTDLIQNVVYKSDVSGLKQAATAADNLAAANAPGCAIDGSVEVLRGEFEHAVRCGII